MTNNNTNPLETMLALEAENKRLREALEVIQPFAEACATHEFNGKYPGKTVYGYNGVGLTFDALNGVLNTLSQPPVTTGLLDVVKAAVQLDKFIVVDDCPIYGLIPAMTYGVGSKQALNQLHLFVEALPPDVREMVEGLE